MINYLEELNKKKELYLRVKVRSSAPKTILKDIMKDETIKIDIVAKAEKGKANQELINFLAANFSVSKNNVKIISGKTDRVKLIKIWKISQN